MNLWLWYCNMRHKKRMLQLKRTPKSALPVQWPCEGWTYAEWLIQPLLFLPRHAWDIIHTGDVKLNFHSGCFKGFALSSRAFIITESSDNRALKSECTRFWWLKLLSTHASDGAMEKTALAIMAKRGISREICCQYSMGWGWSTGTANGPKRWTHWPIWPLSLGRSSSVWPNFFF